MGQSVGKGKAEDATGLSDREKRMVQDVWRAFTEAHPNDFGPILFSSLFVTHPEYLQLFSKFKDHKVSQLLDDPKFRAHGAAVGTHLGNLVNSLDQPQKVIELIQKNADFHTTIKGVKPEYFVNFGKVIVAVLSVNHENMMTKAAVNAWEKVFQAMNSHFSAVFEDHAHKDRKSDAYKLATMSVVATKATGSRFPQAVPAKGKRSKSATRPGKGGLGKKKTPAKDSGSRPGTSAAS